MTNRNVNINVNGKDNASKAFGKVGKGADGLSNQIGSLKRAFGWMVGGAIIHRAIGGLMETAASMDEVGKASDRIGVATEALVGLKWAAEQSGDSFESLEKGLTKLNRNLSEIARGGAKTAADSLAEIGLSADELFKLPFEQRFGMIADGINRVENPADKTRIAMNLFGKSGSDLLNLLGTGSEGLKAFREEAEEMGMVFTREDAAKMEEFNDAINKLSTSIGALKIALVGMAGSELTTGLKVLTDTINGTESVESAAFWAASLKTPFSDPMDDPSLKKYFTAGETTAADSAARLAELRRKHPNDPNLMAEDDRDIFKEKQQKERSAAAIGQVTDYFTGKDLGKSQSTEMKKATADRDEIMNIVSGFQGLGDVVGSVVGTGTTIGESLVKGIEVGWDESKGSLKNRIDDLTNSLRSPAEIFRDSMAELADLEGRGLGAETANRRRSELTKAFEATLPSLKEDSTQLAAREFRALRSAPGADSPALRAAKESAKQTKLAERQLLIAEASKNLLQDIKDQQPSEANL